jgi:hypothetical protein
MRNVSDKICRENQNTFFMLKNFFSENRAVYNVEKYGTARQATDGNIIRRTRFARWVIKTTDTHTEYVILITFPRQEWLRERVSVLRYMYSACLVIYFYVYLISSGFWSQKCPNQTTEEESLLGHTVSQAVSRRPVIAETRVSFEVVRLRSVVDKVAVGQVFPYYLGVPLSVFFRSFSILMHSSITDAIPS